MKSIIQKEKRCYICGLYDVEEHHVFFGTANRKMSEKYGLKVYLCYEHHRGTLGVHGKLGHGLDLRLKRDAERRFIMNGGTVEEFIKLFGRNVL